MGPGPQASHWGQRQGRASPRQCPCCVPLLSKVTLEVRGQEPGLRFQGWEGWDVSPHLSGGPGQWHSGTPAWPL